MPNRSTNEAIVMMLRWICISIVLLLVGCGGLDSVADIDTNVILNNNIIEVQLSPSGSISYVSEIGKENLINNHDLGRQIQQSFYAGEDRTYSDQYPAWSPWPWNITQSGDVYGNESDMVVTKQTTISVSTTTIPMRWDRNNIPEYGALLSNDITLIGNMVRVHVTLELSVNCDIINPQPRHQEMPAIYTISKLNHLISGENTILNRDNKWVYWSNEEWAGAFDDSGYGIAVYLPDTELFIGGRYEDGEDKTTYFSPLQTITLKPGDELSYTYWIIIGTVPEILFNIQNIKG